MIKNGTIEESLIEFCKGKSLEATIKSELKEGLAKILKGLAEQGDFSLEINYFSSNHENMCDVQDNLNYNFNKKLLEVRHEPIDENDLYINDTWNLNIDEYINKLKFPNSITFLEMFYITSNERDLGEIIINKFYSPEYPEIKELGGASYISKTKYNPNLFVTCKSNL